MIDDGIKKISEKYSRFHCLSKESKDAMMEYEWGGNILQLDNFIERLILTATKRNIEIKSVKDLLEILYVSTSESLNSVGRVEEIKSVLKKNNGNRLLTANELKISKATLWRWIKKYNIET